jgi:hypothetical protein
MKFIWKGIAESLIKVIKRPAPLRCPGLVKHFQFHLFP